MIALVTPVRGWISGGVALSVPSCALIGSSHMLAAQVGSEEEDHDRSHVDAAP
jgi:hypothetical protein